MVSFLLIIGNEKERQILSLAFTQLNVKVITSTPTYSNFIKVKQYNPDIIIIEIPRVYTDQLHFIQLVRKHCKSKKIPVFGYGAKLEEGTKWHLIQNGISVYFEKPLKFTNLMQSIHRCLEQMNKPITAPVQNPATEKEGDIALITDPKTLPLKKIELIIKHVTKFMAFPFTIAHVLQLSENSKAGAADLAHTIEADPVISAMILKIANSVFFASANRRISSIKDAIVRIGFKETKRIVTTMSVLTMSDTSLEKNIGFNRYQFWYHSLSTALIAERIARSVPELGRDEIFLSGLLHDFYIILLDEFYPGIFEKILEATLESGGTFFENAYKIIGVSPNGIMKELFSSWKIPPAIITAVCDQSSILNAKDPIAAPEQCASLCVAMAHTIAKTFCLGTECEQYTMPVPRHFFISLKMPYGLGKNFLESIKHDLSLYRSILHIDDIEPITSVERHQIGFINTGDTLFFPFIEYLKILGHGVTPVSIDDVEKLTTAETEDPFDCIFVLLSNTTPLERLAPLYKLYQRPKENRPSSQPLPVLAFLPYNYPMSKEVTNNTLSLIYDCGDLRHIENIMDTTVGHTQVLFPIKISTLQEYVRDDGAAPPAAST